MLNMTRKEVQEMIKKYRLSLMEKDGQTMIRCTKPPRSQKILAKLKEAKPEIVEELQRQKAELDAQAEQRRLEREREAQEYLDTADLRRCLVVILDEYYRVDRFIATLEIKRTEDGLRAYNPKHGGPKVFRRVNLPHETETIEALKGQGAAVPYGIDGAAIEITPEQENAIVAETEAAIAEAKKQAVKEKAAAEAEEAEKKRQAEEELAQKFAEAKETGKPVHIRRYTTACSDPSEECNLDIVNEYAMPDGTVKRTQDHTW